MPRYTRSLPPLRHHRGSGRAYVRLSGRDCYCGRWDGRPPIPHEVARDYDKLVSAWLANGRRELPKSAAVSYPTEYAQPPESAAEYTVEDLIADFWRYAEQRYKQHVGHASGELGAYRSVLRALRRFHGGEPPDAFGPKKLRSLRQRLLEGGWLYFTAEGEQRVAPPWCRTNVNRAVNRLKRLFRWGVAEELVPPAVAEGLRAVDALRAGEVPPDSERETVRGVDPAIVAATVSRLPKVVAAMVEIQMRCGCRPGELVCMRVQDLDRSGEVWIYAPRRHKTARHGHSRAIYLDCESQAVLTPLLPASGEGYVFRPSDALAETRAKRAQARITPVYCGNRPGQRSGGLAGDLARRPPGDCYTVASYRRAIQRACDRAGVEAWHPHQLRHTAARRWVEEHDPETARALLGHKTASMTRLYATDEGADRVLAMRAMLKQATRLKSIG